jgi:hypothetical protein
MRPEFVTVSYSEPAEPTLHPPHTVFHHHICVQVSLQSHDLNSVSDYRMPKRAPCSASLISLDSITVNIRSKGEIVEVPTCYVLLPHAVSPLLGANILLEVCLQTPSTSRAPTNQHIKLQI